MISKILVSHPSISSTFPRTFCPHRDDHRSRIHFLRHHQKLYRSKTRLFASDFSSKTSATFFSHLRRPQEIPPPPYIRFLHPSNLTLVCHPLPSLYRCAVVPPPTSSRGANHPPYLLLLCLFIIKVTSPCSSWLAQLSLSLADDHNRQSTILAKDRRSYCHLDI